MIRHRERRLSIDFANSDSRHREASRFIAWKMSRFAITNLRKFELSKDSQKTSLHREILVVDMNSCSFLETTVSFIASDILSDDLPRGSRSAKRSAAKNTARRMFFRALVICPNGKNPSRRFSFFRAVTSFFRARLIRADRVSGRLRAFRKPVAFHASRNERVPR